MKWFRLYSSVLNDPKVQQLSPELFKHWINILCVASEHEPRGELPSLEALAFALRIRPSYCAKVIKRLSEAGLLEDSSRPVDGQFTTSSRLVEVHNWNNRQRESDDISTRVERHRHRKSAASDDLATGNVTLHETLLKRSVDTDTDTDKETETLQVSGKVSHNAAVVAPAAPAAAAASSINGHNHWDAESAKRTAEEVARKVRLPPSKVADMADYIRACPLLSHELVIGEAISYTDWLNKAHKGAEARVFFNRWLKPANEQREQQRQQQHALNSHSSNGKSEILNGQQQQLPASASAARPAEPDIAYAYHLEQAKAARTKMVS